MLLLKCLHCVQQRAAAAYAAGRTIKNVSAIPPGAAAGPVMTRRRVLVTLGLFSSSLGSVSSSFLVQEPMLTCKCKYNIWVTGPGFV
ncbi:hypothetical protein L596_027370 [Steinernema carpocapsae]|uniref:Uncharacterized protein n=1 Tax=Steinernema carpocapsae TaxID=34508 RepID=A0A4U5M447_STECR|nr:hypothetical protein L596_027370 [Steinernema carpocapsae]